MKSFLKLIRPLNCLMAAFAALIGAYLGNITVILPTSLAMASAFLICGGGMVINDYYDRDLDFIHNSDRPIPSGKVSLKAALVFSFLLFSIGIFLSFWINTSVFVLAIVNSLFLVGYAKELQKKVFLSNLIVSFLVASTFVFGGLSVGNFFPSLFLGILAFFANTAREVIKDIEDKIADASKGVQSLPMVLGENKSRMISSGFIIISILLSPLPLVFNVFDIKYAFAVIPCIVVFSYSVYLNEKEEDSSEVQSMIKLGMLLGLVAFLAGSF